MKTINSRRDFICQGSGLLAAAALAPAGLSAAESTGQPATRQAVEALLDKAEANVEPRFYLPRKEGQFLAQLVELAQARRVLEVGSGFGFASLWLTAALERTGGKLIGLEILPERVAAARVNLAQAPFGKRATFQQGDAHELVTKLDGSFDLVLLNADKGGNVDYFKKLHPDRLSRRAVIMAASAIYAVEKLKDYLALISARADYDTTIVSATMEDGLALSLRHET